MKRAGEVAALIGIVALGLTVRLSHALSSGLWRDEALAVDIALLPSVGDVTDFLANHESHPPLYYLLLRGWIMVAGASDLALILPGVLIGLGTIVLAWWFARQIMTPAAGLLASVLMALSYRGIESDSTVRPYGLLQLLLLGATVLMWRAITTGSRRALRGWVLCSIVSVYLHNWAVLPVASMGLVALWLATRGRSRIPLSLLVIAGFIVALAWSPWVPEVLHQVRHGGHLRPSSNPLLRLAEQSIFVLPGLYGIHAIVAWVGVGAVLLLRRGSPEVDEEQRAAITCLMGTVVLAMLLAGIGSFWTELLIVHTIPMLAPLVLVVFAVVLMRPLAQGRMLATVAAGLVLLLSAIDAARIATTPRTNVDLIARYVARRAGQEDLVLVVTAPAVSTVLRYYHGLAPVAGYPDGIIDSPVRFSDRLARDTAPETLARVPAMVDRTFSRGGRVWLISSEVPKHLRASWSLVESEMTRRCGPPQQVNMLDKEPTLDNMTLRIWSVRTLRTQSAQ